jgi:dolichol-phosphate mannosyltransferase
MIDKLMRFIRSGEIIRFALVGGTGAIIKLGTMYLFADVFHLNIYAAYLLSSILAITSNFVLNTLWTFRDRKFYDRLGTVLGWFRYLLVSCIAIGINEGILFVLTGLMGIWYMFSAGIGIFTAFGVNYFLSRRWVWGTRLPENGDKPSGGHHGASDGVLGR